MVNNFDLIEKNSRPIIGISRCLLGENVRYDGGNTLVKNLIQLIGDEFLIFGVCPEVEMGLGVPREPIQLVKVQKEIRLVDLSRSADYTELAHKTFQRFQLTVCDGFILQSRSPSCGFKSTKLYEKISGEQEVLGKEMASGLFTMYLEKNFSEIPLLDSSNLQTELNSFLQEVKGHYKRRP